jgi:hypothetical protein
MNIMHDMLKIRGNTVNTVLVSPINLLTYKVPLYLRKYYLVQFAVRFVQSGVSLLGVVLPLPAGRRMAIIGRFSLTTLTYKVLTLGTYFGLRTITPLHLYLNITPLP